MNVLVMTSIAMRNALDVILLLKMENALKNVKPNVMTVLLVTEAGLVNKNVLVMTSIAMRTALDVLKMVENALKTAKPTVWIA